MRGVLAQEIHHRVKNNLQIGRVAPAAAGARRRTVDARRRSSDSVNRILAIAAVHEVLTEQREDDVDLGELIDRLRAMLVQGLGAGKRRRAPSSSPFRSRASARLRSRSSSPELLQNALEHGGEHVAIELRAAKRRGRARDRGRRAGIDGEPTGTGLSIVRALVRDELRGELALENAGGLHAEVVFPA